MPTLNEIRLLSSEYLNRYPGQSFTIKDDKMPDVEVIIELSHFSFNQNPKITVTLINFPLEFSDGCKYKIWTFFSTSYLNTNLTEADFRITKIIGKNKTDDEILQNLTRLWNE